MMAFNNVVYVTIGHHPSSWSGESANILHYAINLTLYGDGNVAVKTSLSHNVSAHPGLYKCHWILVRYLKQDVISIIFGPSFHSDAKLIVCCKNCQELTEQTHQMGGLIEQLQLSHH